VERLLSVPVLALTLGLAFGGCATTLPQDGTVAIDSTYGTLRFVGSVERIDRGQDYEFRAAVDAVFQAGAEVNRVEVARLTRYFLEARTDPPEGEPAETIYRDEKAIDVVLSEDGETAPLPEVTFRLPRAVVALSPRLHLAVSSGGIMWPIAELR
jgi:hypothetical protein